MIRNAVIISGDREWTDKELVGRVMGRFPDGTLFIHGNARGADECCDENCSSMGYPRIRIPYYSFAGRSGGPQRNKGMLDILLALYLAGAKITVVGFHDNIQESKGTKHMLSIAKKAGVPTKLVRHK